MCGGRGAGGRLAFKFQKAKKTAMTFCSAPCGMWGHHCLYPRYSLRGQSGSQGRRMSVGPYPKLFQQILACAPFLSVPQSQQETPNQQDLPLIPIPPAISQDLTPEKTHTPQQPGREDPASPRLPPRRGPGFRRTARKPLVRFPQTQSHCPHRSRSHPSEERAGAPGVSVTSCTVSGPPPPEQPLPGHMAPCFPASGWRGGKAGLGTPPWL